jgi:cellulose synthase/poly-beta-1,6-N-acetylglucosamine synthase-like glycosyltransferase
MLQECLQALQRQDYPAFDVWVIDNAPRDERTRACAQRYGVRYAIEPVPGLSRARNLAPRISKADILAYLDDDSLPEPGWLTALVREFGDERVMAVCGKVLPTSLATPAERLYHEALTRRSERLVVNEATPYWFEITNFGGVGDGMNMAFRRSAFESWPGFDERLGLGAPLEGSEEHYALFELVAREYSVVYTPDAVVRHPYPPDMSSLQKRFYKAMVASRGHMMMLFVEQPRYRRELIAYVLRGALNRKRAWIGDRASSSIILPLGQRLRATFAGARRYLQARWKGQPRNAEAPAAVPALDRVEVTSGE